MGEHNKTASLVEPANGPWHCDFHVGT